MNDLDSKINISAVEPKGIKDPLAEENLLDELANEELDAIFAMIA